MDAEDKKIIKDEIAPLVQNGDLTLFLGAGISIATPTVNELGIPSTPDLIKRICSAAGYSKEEADTADLPTAFGVGEDDIDNFENFLISNFTATRPHDWQRRIFQNWWRAIFTTNIDTIPEKCVELNNVQSSKFPSYQVFNYKDREPVQNLPTSPPLVYLHGMVSKPNEGFVFDNVSYAEHSVNQSDWLTKSALHIAHGNCLFVGSKFKESDIESSLRRREIWEGNISNAKNWIVLRSFTSLERKSYLKRGIVPIKANADEFFRYLFSLYTPLTKHKFIKKKAPFLSENTDDKSLAWFTKNMDLVPDKLELASRKKGPFSLFYNGDMPSWFYIVNNVPTNFKNVKSLVEQIIQFESSDERAKIFTVLGPLGSGKTTISMLAMASLAKTHSNIYEYSGLDGINIEATWNVVKDLKGLVVIFIDSSSSYYYAINEIVERVMERSTSCKLCFILEERTIYFERNKRHFNKVAKDVFSHIKVENIDKNDAGSLYDKTMDLGIKFEKLEDLSKEQSIEKIVSFDNGYNGDLLATLYDLSSRKSYIEQLTEEYEEINSLEAKSVFENISLVTASRLAIPVNYLCEVHSFSVEALLSLIQEHLKDKVHYQGVSMTVTSRHHSIAEFHISNNFDKKDLKDTIIQLMRCLSTKFSVEDIKKHPISYKIYSKVMSYHYLTETLFKGKRLYPYIHEIYSECQKYFSDDGVFWLQYGRFLERDKKVDEALHCFRKGLGLYDSFQIRHALGQLLLKKYRLDKHPDDNEFDEGVKLLKAEIDSRGYSDAYPYTALGDELIKIHNKNRNADECASILKETINKGLKYHRDDKFFSKMVGRYFSIVKDTVIS